MGLFGKKKMENTENNLDARIKILGTGCANCNKLEENVKQALTKLDLDMEIAHVKDFSEIAKYGVMRTPALVLDDKVLSMGKVLSEEEVIELFRDKLNG